MTLSAALSTFEFHYLESKLYDLRASSFVELSNRLKPIDDNTYKHRLRADVLDPSPRQTLIKEAPQWINILITVIINISVLSCVMNFSPVIGVLTTLTLTLGLVIFCHVAFQGYGIWIKESLPLLGIFISYYLAVPYRLISEYKARWELQRENELLTQVEEMKTHFISLITHDLKTPVARIQGLAEIALRLARRRQDSTELATLEHLLEATEELDHFINRILELNQVESNHLQIRYEPRDINRVIERTLERFRELSKAKEIEITTDLAPLFAVKIDSELIYKVLSNILDNALKYSPAKSTIRLESGEEKNWIFIRVSDQGIGMTPEEQSQLFTRFFRAKNDITTSIRGTGLGLYLSKFFIEAHRGCLHVQSEINCGSKFTIYLPIDETRLGHHARKKAEWSRIPFRSLKENPYV